MAKKKTTEVIEFPFNKYLRDFYIHNRSEIRREYKPLSKKFLDFNDPENSGAFLRQPQFEALEMYIFLKEYLGNRRLVDIFDDWSHSRGSFTVEKSRVQFQGDLFHDIDARSMDAAFASLRSLEQSYANYIFALTMGVGKTILMATCIFYEFLLANKYPEDPRFCHNALVFAPDTTVLQSLREILDFDKSKVVPAEYASWLEANITFHFLDDSGVTLNTLPRSDFNIIITNTQKVILKRKNVEKSAAQKLFSQAVWAEAMASNADIADLYSLDDETELTTNQRFKKITRLAQLGIYVDEAHHAFGSQLAKDMGDRSSKTSLRLTIDTLAVELERSGTHVVACFNYTGTPYADNHLLPEVVYEYSLKTAIDKGYLKQVNVVGVENAKSMEFIRYAVRDFWNTYRAYRYEGMLAKMAIFASSIDELQNELKPELETTLIEHGIPVESILVNVGDAKLTSNDDIRAFNSLDSSDSEIRFILLVGKGKEGWNCRSLFSVALFREPKSKIFVLQATMRCLRSITEVQQHGIVYLSANNKGILETELQENFRMSVDELTAAGDKKKITVEVRPTSPPVIIRLNIQRKLFRLKERERAVPTDLHIADINTEKYRILIEETAISRLGDHPSRVADASELRINRSWSDLTLVAEISRYLNLSPLKVRALLGDTIEGLPAIVAFVSKYNEALYEHIIPNLFHELYELVEYDNIETTDVKLVKDPPGGCYRLSVLPDLLIDSEVYRTGDPNYLNKSFHLDKYCFDSQPEKAFFLENLPSAAVKNIWFTGMLTHGQTDFVVSYIDPESHALRSYYPDFLIELIDGTYVIVEIKGDNKLSDPVVLAKEDYATRLAASSKMRYIMIPGTEAGPVLSEYLVKSQHVDHDSGHVLING